MSWVETVPPVCSESAEPAIALVIEPRSRDLGGFSVRRVLPAAERQMVGPFVFFDEMGPADFPAGEGINVRPHPHIGLSTVTYLFAGEILHRDSLGYVQPIRPGAINLMTAGRGIVHSERTDDSLRAAGQFLHGIQTWMALPDGQEEIEPAFLHVPASELPVFEAAGLRATVILGSAFGSTSPVPTLIETLYVDVAMAAGAELALPAAPELAAYVVSGTLRAGACALHANTMGVFGNGPRPRLCADTASRVMLAGGAAPGERHVWWNFVSSSLERIEQAKAEWRAGGFARVPGDDEFIPLPGA